jgi:galacturan 1,4-alpha-galacturonidase
MRDLYNIKIAYIGGEMALYDISCEAAERNKKIGERINQTKEAVSKWKYTVYEKIDDSLKNVLRCVPSD